MANYDFSTLNSSDLEELVADLLNAKEREKSTGRLFKTFKDGKDKGVDILCSTPANQYYIIGQVKHYYRSGWNSLFQDLKKEIPKIIKLSPSKYIIATSVDLSVDNTKDIFELFHPYIKSQSDIYGKKDLNRLIKHYPDILNNHFKLWYSSTDILQKLINYHIEGRSNEFKENELKRKIRLYVETPIIYEAREKLNDNNFVILTGEPGSGKTTTAEFLIYEYIKDDYNLVYIYDDIKEAESVWKNDDSRQIFYYDDFLGQNALEIQKAKGSETALLTLLKKVTRSKNKKFIFTTRTFILNDAISESERLRQLDIRAKESTLDISEYDFNLKSRLLTNHIEESEISNELKEVLRNNNVLKFVVNHINFSPRSIEFITSSSNVSFFTAEEFEGFIFHNFDRPDRIWRHAYEQQIDDYDRLLLNTMLSFGDSVYADRLEKAFIARLDYEVKNNNFRKPLSAFRKSFNKIENGFIIEDSHYIGLYKFINPSLVDFLISKMRDNFDEVIRISESVYYSEQLTERLFSINGSTPKHYPSSFLKDKLINNYTYFIKEESRDIDSFVLTLVLFYYIKDENIEQLIIILINKIDDWTFIGEDFTYKQNLITFLERIQSPKLISTIESNLKKILAPNLFEIIDLNDSIQILITLKAKFDFNFKDFLDIGSINEVEDYFSSMVENKMEEDIDELLGYSFAQDFVEEKIQEISQIQNVLLEIGINIDPNTSMFDEYDWQAIGNENYFNEQMAKDD